MARLGLAMRHPHSLVLAAALAAAPACARLLPAPVPMRSIAYPSPTPPARCLVVLLPGAGDHAGTFDEHGFVDRFRRAGLSVDLVAADATMGYYFRGIVWQRLHDDVVAPALVHGYEHVWLLGISMGGMGALMTARNYPELAEGLVLLAPYLGDESLAREIEREGGLARWDPGPLDPAFTEDTYQRHVWRWLKDATRSGEPALYLGYGEADRLAPEARVLAAALPEGHVVTRPGKHDWAPWSQALDAVLERSRLAEACRP